MAEVRPIVPPEVAVSRTPRRPGQARALALLAVGAATAGQLTAATPAHADVVPAPVTVSAPDLVLDAPSAGDRILTSAGWTLRTPVPAVGLWRPGSVTAELDVPAALAGAPGAVLSVKAGADVCEGGAQMDVAVDGAPAGGFDVDADVGLYPLPVPVPAGRHRVVVSYREDHVAPGCDRSLKVLTVTATSAARAPRQRMTAGPASMHPSRGDTAMSGNGYGSRGQLQLAADDSVPLRFTTPAARASTVVVGAAGLYACPPAQYEVRVDGRRLGRTAVTTFGYASETGWQGFPAGPLPAGVHTVSVAFVNDAGEPSGPPCHQNDLVLRSVALEVR